MPGLALMRDLRPQSVGRPGLVGVDILLEMGLEEEWDEELWEGRRGGG